MTTNSAISARIEIGCFSAGKRMAFTTRFDDGNMFDRHVV